MYFKCFATKALHCTLYHTVELAWHKPWSHHPTSKVVLGQRARFWPKVHIALVEGQHRGRTPGLHRGPTLMGSDPTRGRQCGHTGSTRRPGINGETPPTLSHTLAQVRPPTATRAGTRDRDPGRQDCTTCLVSWRLERLLGALDPRGPPSLILFFHPLSLSLSLTHSRPPILLSVFVTQFCFIS